MKRKIKNITLSILLLWLVFVFSTWLNTQSVNAINEESRIQRSNLAKVAAIYLFVQDSKTLPK